ncbi:PEP-CTERM sorting domain-containing protein [Candidatus Spyradosoma sp. SGI.093]|uniref:PEP-CTERM sorting domain-containing protein n=1 Tax=Candidatus Spyradosoma sp. SGI.093 TaxID=3420583 RepID=UPI003D03F4FF
MKKLITITTLLAAGAALANAETIWLPITTSTGLSQSSLQPDRDKTEAQAIEALLGYNAGSYAGGNNNSLSNWGTNSEGVVSGSIDAGYSVTLLGRSGVGGDWFGSVIDASSLSLPSDESLLSFNLSFTGASGTISPNVKAILALKTDSGVYYETLASTAGGANGNISWNVSSISDIDTVSKFAVYFQGAGGTATSSYTISNIKASLTTGAIPEPSAFGLLAGLGALALAGTRRRRRK